jgi:hypothetical protein
MNVKTHGVRLSWHAYCQFEPELKNDKVKELNLNRKSAKPYCVF